MVQLTAYIPALLHRYDCVVIPGLGGFVANYSPARLDQSKGVIYPPSKGIIFNKNLVRNDGLLVNEIAGAENIGYEEALARVNAFVQESKLQLAQGGRIELEGLGYLYFDQERNLQYLQHHTVNFLNDSFGLAPVMAVPLAKKVVELKADSYRPVVELKPAEVAKEKEKVKEPVKTETPTKEATVVAMKEVVEKVNTHRRKYYWVAAVLLPVLFYSYWLPFQTPMLTTGEFKWSYLNPFSAYVAPVYQERVQPVADNDEALIKKADSIVQTISMPPVAYEQMASETTQVVMPVVNQYNRYHVIAGCFINYDNAITQINELNAAGNQAYLFGKANGFHRVALGSFATEAEATAYLQAIRQNGQPKAWLLQE